MKSLVDDTVVTCHWIVDTLGTTSINPNEKTNYWPIGVVLLKVLCSLLLVLIVVKYGIKHGYYYNNFMLSIVLV